MTELDPETKARIEAEEQYRAQTRARIEQPQNMLERDRIDAKKTPSKPPELTLKQEGKRILYWILGLGVLTVIGAIGSYATKDLPPPKVEPEPKVVAEFTTIEFDLLCQKMILDQLKAPKTAQFEDFGTRIDQIQTSVNGYFWPGVVDAQNSFGALIRSKFKCVWTRKTDNITARIVP
jgi:hypothetical protein